MPDFATSFTTGTIQGNKNSALRIFTEAGDTQSLHFWSNFDPFFLLKIAEIKKKKTGKKEKKKNFGGKNSAIGLSKNCKIRTYLFSPSKWKIGLLFALFEHFLVKIWARSKVKGSK